MLTRTDNLEQWFRSLAAVTAGTGDEADRHSPNVLFVLDNDFGELTTVLYLILGQPCFANSRILASPRVYTTNRSILPGKIQLWKRVQDIIQVIQSDPPQLLVLASGYLLPVHRLLTVDGLAKLLDCAARRGVRVVTADPFLGLVSVEQGEVLADRLQVPLPDNAPEHIRSARDVIHQILDSGLRGAEALLRDHAHLYPAFCSTDGVAPRLCDARNLSFFNDRLVVPADRPEDSGEPPHWMFLMAFADYQTQTMFVDPVELARQVAARMTDALDQGRRAIFLAPDELLTLMRHLLPPSERIEYISFCSFFRAMSLLLTAEFCFYWNLVSHSIIMQRWNARPVVLLDQGHLVRAMPALAERIHAWYYQGVIPPQISVSERFDADELRSMTRISPHTAKALLARYQRAVSPASMLTRLTA